MNDARATGEAPVSAAELGALVARGRHALFVCAVFALVLLGRALVIITHLPPIHWIHAVPVTLLCGGALAGLAVVSGLFLRADALELARLARSLGRPDARRRGSRLPSLGGMMLVGWAGFGLGAGGVVLAGSYLITFANPWLFVAPLFAGLVLFVLPVLLGRCAAAHAQSLPGIRRGLEAEEAPEAPASRRRRPRGAREAMATSEAARRLEGTGRVLLVFCGLAVLIVALGCVGLALALTAGPKLTFPQQLTLVLSGCGLFGGGLLLAVFGVYQREAGSVVRNLFEMVRERTSARAGHLRYRTRHATDRLLGSGRLLCLIGIVQGLGLTVLAAGLLIAFPYDSPYLAASDASFLLGFALLAAFLGDLAARRAGVLAALAAALNAEIARLELDAPEAPPADA